MTECTQDTLQQAYLGSWSEWTYMSCCCSLGWCSGMASAKTDEYQQFVWTFQRQFAAFVNAEQQSPCQQLALRVEGGYCASPRGQSTWIRSSYMSFKECYAYSLPSQTTFPSQMIEDWENYTRVGESSRIHLQTWVLNESRIPSDQETNRSTPSST